jgi:hypothetical protein
VGGGVWGVGSMERQGVVYRVVVKICLLCAEDKRTEMYHCVMGVVELPCKHDMHMERREVVSINGFIDSYICFNLSYRALPSALMNTWRAASFSSSQITAGHHRVDLRPCANSRA